jgi:TPR repeat protein
MFTPRWLLAVAAFAGACGDREPAPPAAREAHDPGRARGQEMLQAAQDCLAVEADRRAPRCQRACALGHSNSCARVGDDRLDAGDPIQAKLEYERACRGGSGLGCDGAARLATAPAEIQRLEREARGYLRVHCEQDHAPSCLALSRMFRDGRGGVTDAAVAAHYAARACALGERDACSSGPPGRSQDTARQRH